MNPRSIRIALTYLVVIMSLISLFSIADSATTSVISPHQVLTTYTPPCPAGAVCPRLATSLTVTTPETWILPSHPFTVSGRLTVDGTDNGIPREPVNVLVFGYITSTVTDDSGQYALTLTTSPQEGDYELTASFPGDSQWAPAQASLSISVSSHIPSQPSPPDFRPFAFGILLIVVLLVLVVVLIVQKRKKQASSSQIEPQETAAIPQKQPSLFCRYCGGLIQPDSIYCDKCRSKLR